MRPAKLQFFFLYQLLGSLFPFIGIYFREERGFTNPEVGLAMALATGGTFVTPILLTHLADTRHDPRRLVAFLFATSALALTALYHVRSVPLTMACWAVHSFASAAILPLNDGLAFSLLRQRTRPGLPSLPYHVLRVWGTVGFILPSILVWGARRSGWSLDVILVLAVATSVLAIANTFTLPPVPDVAAPADPGPPGQPASAPGVRRLPSLDAARLLFRGNSLAFCGAIGLGQLTSSAFYAFYPIYLREQVGIDPQWIGLIFNVGVAIEVPFILAFGTLHRRLGFRRLVALGLAASSVRLALLALFPSAATAIAVQALHGIHVLALIVAPPVFLDSLAADRTRHSIQGLYSMAVIGPSRIAGSLLAGGLAGIGLSLSFGLASTFALAGSALLLAAFRDHSR